MEKRVAKILIGVLAFLLMFSLAGCGEQSKFIGFWETSIDMTESINKGIAEDKDLAKYVEIEDFSIALIIEFNDDGTYKKYVDEGETKKAIEEAKEDFKKGLNNYFEDYIKDEGLTLSVDEVIELSGIDVDSMIEEVFGEELYQTLETNMKAEGNFKVKDGKLFLSDGLENDIDENLYDTYEITENKLTLLETIGGEEDEMKLYPLMFERVE